MADPAPLRISVNPDVMDEMVGFVLSSMVKVTEMLVDTLLLPSVARTYTVLPPPISKQV